MKLNYVSVMILAGSFLLTNLPIIHAQSNQNNPANPPVSAVIRPDLNIGSQGEFVRELQAALKLLGYYNSEIDGMYGQNTARAVSLFQENAQLNATGVVNQQTWNRLFPLTSPNTNNPTVTVATNPTSTNSPNTTNNNQSTTTNNNRSTTTNNNSSTTTNTNPPSSNNRRRAEDLPILKEGMEGDEVKLLQERLKSLGFYNGVIDGVFGPNTLQAVMAAQTYFRLEGDGIVGLQTWKKLLGQ